MIGGKKTHMMHKSLSYNVYNRQKQKIPEKSRDAQITILEISITTPKNFGRAQLPTKLS